MGAYTLRPAGGHPTVWRVLPGKPGFHFRFFSGRWLFPLPATPPDSVRTRHIHGVTTYGTYPWGGQTACSRNQGKRRANATVQNRWNRCNLRIVKKSLVICSFPDQPVQKKQFSWFRDRVVDMVMIFFGCWLSTFLKHTCSFSQSVFFRIRIRSGGAINRWHGACDLQGKPKISGAHRAWKLGFSKMS